MKLNCHKVTITILLISLFLSSFPVTGESRAQPMAVEGHLQVTDWDFSHDKLLLLNGQWEFYWLNLLEPSDFANSSLSLEPVYISLPNELTRIEIDGKKLSADGYGTLRLNISNIEPNKLYGLKARYLSSASRIWVNGNEISSIGIVGDSPDSYLAKYLPVEAFFYSNSDSIELIIQIANFHHNRIRLQEILLGSADQIKNHSFLGIIRDSLQFGSLLLMALYYFILYYLQRKDRAFIFFAIISFIVGLRIGVLNERILLRLLPDLPAEIVMKIGFLPVFILLPLLILYIREITHNKNLDYTARLAKYAIFLFSVLLLTTTIKTYDQVFKYGLIAILLWGLYIISILFTKNIFENNKTGLYVMVTGGTVIFFAAANDYLRELDYIHTPELLSTGILVFILLQAFFLAWRYDEAFIKANQLAEENASMYEEIQELNKSLETKVLARTKELEIANNKLEELSKLDPLTGLANRRFFDERLKQEWQISLSEQLPLSIIIIDIDYFKDYNDNYGHLEGDFCLRAVAESLSKQLCHNTSFIARYGGEEFVTLLPSTDLNNALAVAEKLRHSVESLAIPHHFSKVCPWVTISLGVNSLIIEPDSSVNDFIDGVDKALYSAKQSGRNQVTAYAS